MTSTGTQWLGWGGFSLLLHGLLMGLVLPPPGPVGGEPAPRPLVLRLVPWSLAAPPVAAPRPPVEVATPQPVPPVEVVTPRPVPQAPAATATPSPVKVTHSPSPRRAVVKPQASRSLETTASVVRPLVEPPAPQEKRQPGPGLLPQREQLLATINASMERYFHYPSLARRRHWEGRVVLSFQVSPVGRLEEIRISESSGHEILDQAAVTALSQVENLPMGAFSPLERKVALRLPVIFKLTSG